MVFNPEVPLHHKQFLIYLTPKVWKLRCSACFLKSHPFAKLHTLPYLKTPVRVALLRHLNFQLLPKRYFRTIFNRFLIVINRTVFCVNFPLQFVVFPPPFWLFDIFSSLRITYTTGDPRQLGKERSRTFWLDPTPEFSCRFCWKCGISSCGCDARSSVPRSSSSRNRSCWSCRCLHE